MVCYEIELCDIEKYVRKSVASDPQGIFRTQEKYSFTII